jgi:hypothetical protein
MKKLLFLTTLLLTSFISKATTYQVGSTRLYTTPNALYSASVVQDGDTIEIDSETFTGTPCLAVWQADNLYIKGVGTGKPHMKANCQYIWGKGIWVLAGDNIRVDNIEFSEASVPSQNGAGIRLDGIGMTVQNCYFHDNENGILTANSQAGDILIEYTEFDHNGYGDGFTHNLYIGHVNKLTFRFNYSHHAYIGHNLKSRANENYILYNRIMDEQTGESSRLIDLPNGGFSIIMGNLLMQGSNAQNNNLVGYGLEGLTNTLSEIYFVNNTLVNKRTASCIFVSLAAATTVATVTNNIFTGTGTVINGTTTAMSNNIIDPVIANLNFIDEATYDYHLISNSSAVNAGTTVNSIAGHSLSPDSTYEHPTSFGLRIASSTIDAGAYEYNSPTAIAEISSTKLTLYPNPFIHRITLKGVILKNSEIALFNLLGQDFSALISVRSEGNNTIIYTSNLGKGMYILQTKTFSSIISKE